MDISNIHISEKCAELNIFFKVSQEISWETWSEFGSCKNGNFDYFGGIYVQKFTKN